MGGSLQSRILVLGIDDSGKTTFLNKLEHPKQDMATSPTESYEVRDVKFKGVKFNVWDISGKESTRSLWSSYYKQGGVDAIVWVVDASNEKRIEESKRCLETQMRDPALAGKVLYVLANKQDVSGALNADDLAKKLQLNQFDGKRHHFIKGISAKTGDNVKEAMDHLAKEMKVQFKEEKEAAKSNEKKDAPKT